jgi:hypothetical protein
MIRNCVKDCWKLSEVGEVLKLMRKEHKISTDELIKQFGCRTLADLQWEYVIVRMKKP